MSLLRSVRRRSRPSGIYANQTELRAANGIDNLILSSKKLGKILVFETEIYAK